jgi:uncharacterized membrane protein
MTRLQNKLLIGLAGTIFCAMALMWQSLLFLGIPGLLLMFYSSYTLHKSLFASFVGILLITIAVADLKFGERSLSDALVAMLLIVGGIASLFYAGVYFYDQKWRPHH